MATDENVLAICVDPSNPNQDITYSLVNGTYRVIGTAQQYNDLKNRGVPVVGLTTDLFDGLAQQAGWGPG